MLYCWLKDNLMTKQLKHSEHFKKVHHPLQNKVFKTYKELRHSQEVTLGKAIIVGILLVLMVAIATREVSEITKKTVSLIKIQDSNLPRDTKPADQSNESS